MSICVFDQTEYEYTRKMALVDKVLSTYVFDQVEYSNTVEELFMLTKR